MAAYAALISLSNTIDRILNHNRISISLQEKQQLLSLLEYVTSFEAFLAKFSDKFNNLEMRMRESAHEAEDIIEYFMFDQVTFQTKVINILLQKTIKYIHSKDYEGGADCPIRKDYMVGWFRRFIDDDIFICKDTMVSSSSTADSFMRKDLVTDLKDRLCGESSGKLQVIPICGERGIGKTTLARYFYHDPSIMEHFEIRVWVDGTVYDNADEVLSRILESFDQRQSYDEKVSEVYKILMGRRYLIVIDDIWDLDSSGIWSSCEWDNPWNKNVWDYVRRAFPDNHNGSCVMLTTTSCLASYYNPSSKIYGMAQLDVDQSWDALKLKVFGDEECPSELEKIGKEIARCCKGWPLALEMIAGILTTTTRTYASWKEWAEEYRDESGCYKHQLQLEKVMEEIDLINGEVREINDVQHNALRSSPADSIIININTMQISAAASSSGKVTSMKKNNIKRGGAAAPHIIVGFDDYILYLKDRLCGEPSNKLQVIPICGMGGIGKTTLARSLYHDPSITNHFDIRVWVTISQVFSAQRILSSLVESLKEFDKGGLGQSDDEKVYKTLFRRRYLVVMDDIWNCDAWDIVRRVLPDDSNGSRVMLTTRLSDVASYPDPSGKLCEMTLLNEYESWNLLKQNVFGDEDCPSKLQDIGKKIARSCKGLPLSIVVIAGLLSTTMWSLVSWKVMAENVKSAEHYQIEEILALSYDHLPQYLKPCFLYMGSFPEDHEIRVKELIRLWIAEGFVKSPLDSDSFEKVAEEFLEELVKRNLVLVTKRKWDGRIKRCSLHDLMRDLCIRKSHESEFFLNMRKWDRRIGDKSFIENIRDQRRVSVYSSNLKFFSSLHSSTIRSIKCFRNHSAYDIERLDFLESVRLLRVLAAENFDVELVDLDELFHLRYLAIWRCSPCHLSLLGLQNLQTLVIYGGFSMESFKLKWCMTQLRHVHFNRGIIDFDYPKETDCPLESLQTLSWVKPYFCKETILKMIPNVKRLKINCSNGLNTGGGVYLDDLVHLHRLEYLKIDAGEHVMLFLVMYCKVTFPIMLKKLILRRWKFPWNDIFVCGSLPHLQVLKLIDCDCVGGTWETTEGTFPVLEVLNISRSRFKNWLTESSHFPKLKCLQLNSCEDLNEISNDIIEIPTLELIEVTGYVRKALIDSIELIRKEQEDMGNDTLQVVCTADDDEDDDSVDEEDDDSGDDDKDNVSGDDEDDVSDDDEDNVSGDDKDDVSDDDEDDDSGDGNVLKLHQRDFGVCQWDSKRSKSL